MTQSEFGATITAIVAILLSLISIAVSVDANRRSNAAQAKLVALEEDRERDRLADRGRALVRAEFFRIVKGPQLQRWLRFSNTGNATARNVVVTVNGKPIDEDRRLVLGEKRFAATIGAGAHLDVIATAELGVDPNYRVVISWDDDSGVPGRWESDLRN